MRNRNSYIDALNAGRERRTHSPYEDLDRTLKNLEARLDSLSAEKSRVSDRDRREEIAQRLERLSATRSRPGRPEPEARADQPADKSRMENEFLRRQEIGLNAIARIAEELKNLRTNLTHEMTAGLKLEFDVLRRDIEKAYVAATNGRNDADFAEELERIAEAIQLLAGRHDGDGMERLHSEIEDIKASLGGLAREDTLRAIDNRWSELGRRFDNLEDQLASLPRADQNSGILDGVQRQLDALSGAIGELPASLSIEALDGSLRSLAENVEKIARLPQSPPPELLEQIEQRLDEISRAIVASSVSVQAITTTGNEPLDRIEARISALSDHMEQLSRSKDDAGVADRISTLAERIEEMVSQGGPSDGIVDQLNERLANIAEKIDAAAGDSGLVQAIGAKLDNLTDHLANAGTSNETLPSLATLESRLDEIVRRLDQPPTASLTSDNEAVRNLERQLAALSQHLSETGNSQSVTKEIAPRLASIESSLESTRNNIESHLAALTQNFSRSGSDDSFSHDIVPRLVSIETSLESARDELETRLAALSRNMSEAGSGETSANDIGARLAAIESSLDHTRETVLEVARLAADEAIRSAPAERQDDSILHELTADLKDLEALTRRSEERNTKTFEAIHATLLKIVDRLGELENTPAQALRPESEFLPIQDMPSLDDGIGEPLGEPAGSRGTAGKAGDAMSPAQAAAAAAMAALEGRREIGASGRPGKSGKSLFGGLSRAFSGNKANAETADPAHEPETVLAVEEDEIAHEQFTGETIADEPLEPGSGAPDLQAIMKKVREEKNAPDSRDNAKTAQADFIAAARRAAQAAAAEAEVHKNAPGKAKKSGKSDTSGLLKRNRTTILLGATAMMVLLAGYQLGNVFLGGGEQAGNAMMTAPAPAAAINDNEQAVGGDADMAATKMADEGGELASAPPVGDDTGEPAESPVASAPGSDRAVPDPDQAATGPAKLVEHEPDIDPVQVAEPSPPEEHTLASAQPQSYPLPPENVGSVGLREAAAAGDPKAMFEIASRYAEGRGIGTDLAEAAKWYERAANLGLAPAQYRIGNILEKGTGADRDLKAAMNWYRKAATQGNASAMHNLAVLYAMGASGQADNDSAARWFLKAAELGVTDSQFNLGILAAKGAGMPRDLEESYKWFALAAKSGDKDAAKKRDEVAKALPPEQLEKARVAADLWKVKPLSTQANSVDIPDGWIDGGATTASVDMKKAIKNIQLLLINHGYDPGAPDGVMGEKTRNAITAYQKDSGLPQTGQVDEKLVRKLLENDG